MFATHRVLAVMWFCLTRCAYLSSMYFCPRSRDKAATWEGRVFLIVVLILLMAVAMPDIEGSGVITPRVHPILGNDPIKIPKMVMT